MYAALSYSCMRPEATSVCGLKQRTWSHESDDKRLLSLANTVDARLGLLVHHWIPVAVEDDDRVRRLPLEACIFSFVFS